MKKRILLPFLVLAIFASATAAVAPNKPQVVTGFVPVTLNEQEKPFESVPPISVVIDPNWVFESPSLAPRPQVNVEPDLIIENLTTPKPVVHNKYVPSVATARRYAMNVLGSVQYSCIDQIFIHESHWNPYDLNRSSGAYGIPQALPGSKMAVIADDWRTNPVTQVKWGIRYVNQRYGSACAAWSFWQVNRWY